VAVSNPAAESLGLRPWPSSSSSGRSPCYASSPGVSCWAASRLTRSWCSRLVVTWSTATSRWRSNRDPWI